MSKTTQTVVAMLRTGQKVDFGEGRARGTVKSIQALVLLEDGSQVKIDLHRMVEITTEDSDLCPNGQDMTECGETDPCEMCWQDQNEEGDRIEASMGLRDRDEDDDPDPNRGCKGCTGTCCTGVNNEPCTC